MDLCSWAQGKSFSFWIKSEMNLKDFLRANCFRFGSFPGAPEISKDLLFRGAGIHEKDRNANNLLHHAAGNGDIPMIELLLGSGISKEAINRAVIHL